MKKSVLIAIPALNEEAVLADSVNRVRAFIDEALGAYDVTVLIADNGSTDGTERIGRELAATMPSVAYLRVEMRGKGNAVAAAWGSRDADVYVFMDADLATDLAALPELLRRIDDGAGLAVGSRFLEGAAVRRSLFRRLLSSGYRRFLHAVLGVKTGDAPCGFKAASAAVVRDVLPVVQNKAWFFDSELIVRAERAGFRVDEVPVTWREVHPSGRPSKVRVASLISEYVREVLRLRRELGAVTVSQDERAERRFVLAVAVLLMILSSIVPVHGWYVAREAGIEWNGRASFAPGDLAMYLSSISQASHGTLFIENPASTEPTIGVPNPVWFSVGMFSLVTGVSPLAAFHIARVMAIAIAVFTFWRAARFFLAERISRLIALAILSFGSGLGAYCMYVLSPSSPRPGAFEWPTDLWVAESNFFASAGYSPHFVASWLLQVLSLFLLARAFSRRKMRDAVCGGIVALALLSFHPFYAPTLYGVAIAWAGLWIRRRGVHVRDVSLLVVFLACTIPAVAYYAWLIFGTSNGRFMHDANLLWTPSLPLVLIGFGVFVALAPFGFSNMRSNEQERRWRGEELALWVLVNLILVYVPVSFQRRLLEGVQFPLALLAGAALAPFALRIVKANPFVTAFAGIATLAMFLPSSFFVIARDVQANAAHDPRSFFAQDESAALAWIRTSTPRQSVVLASFSSGNDVIGWGERRVYLGHWSQTIGLGKKNEEVSAFFSTMSSTERLEFVHNRGISYVLEGPAERAFGGTLAGDTRFIREFGDGAYAVYSPRQ